MKPDQEIWILDDHPECRFRYEDILSSRYRLLFLWSLADLRQALDVVRPFGFRPMDLLIADLKISDGYFLDYLAEDGNSPFPSPFMVVSSFDDLDVLRRSFEAGALDYLVKPFRTNELVAKVERLLRPHPTEARAQGKLRINSVQLQASRDDGRVVQLTAKELRILSALMESGLSPISRARLQGRVWGETKVSDNTLDVHLFNLRRKLLGVGAAIRFHRPDGFSLELDPPAAV